MQWYPHRDVLRHHQIPSELLHTLVNALVFLHVRYCLAVYGNESELSIQRLKKVINFALRVISVRRKFDHISDVREELSWPILPVSCTNITHLAYFTKFSLPATHRVLLLRFGPTPLFAPALPARTLIWLSRA